MHITQQIDKFAKQLGFNIVGFSPAHIENRYLQAFKGWLDSKNEGQMEYMQKIAERSDLSKILPGAKSVIVLATNYYNEQHPLKKDHGRIARYAYGRDYHKVIGKRLKKLQKFIEELAPESKNKAYVDTGPILERALAEQAGIGRIGKNTCLITPEYGSWVFLSEIITTLDLASSSTHRSNVTPLPKDQPSTSYSIPSTALASSIKKSGPRTTFQANPLAQNSKKHPNLVICPDQTTKSAQSQKSPGTNPRSEEKRASSQKALTSAESPPRKSNLTPLSKNQPITPWNNPSSKPGNVCGGCTKCIQACPTGAIIAPGVIDSRLCISYLTIENRDKIPPELAKIIKEQQLLYGCDICQEVCPHNQKRQKSITETESSTSHGSLQTPPIATDQISLKKINQLKDQDHFIQTFAGSPLTRAKKTGLQRNASVLKDG